MRGISFLVLVAGASLGLHVAALAGEASFPEFDRRAQAGEQLTVGFFGASLTWGANATDPQLTSYRALVGQRLADAYPKARFRFYDAAIGGTTSIVGAFRLERDVLRRNPDLVFLDFIANDGAWSKDPETLASYESLLRRLILEAHVPVIPVIFPFKWEVEVGTVDGMSRREDCLALANAYGTGAGDAILLGQERVKGKQATIEQYWPVDGSHPCDVGYAMFADAAWTAFREAVDRKRVCSAPPPT